MSVTARRKITLTYSGDVDGEQELNAADNADSPAQIENKALQSGVNVIEVPAGATAVTILPPGDNVTSLTFVPVEGETGVRLHNTDPTTIALHSSVADFVLFTGGAMTVRLFWT